MSISTHCDASQICPPHHTLAHPRVTICRPIGPAFAAAGQILIDQSTLEDVDLDTLRRVADLPATPYIGTSSRDHLSTDRAGVCCCWTDLDRSKYIGGCRSRHIATRRRSARHTIHWHILA